METRRKEQGVRRVQKRCIEVHTVKPLTPTRAIDALIREQTETKKPTLDYSVAYYDPHRSYSESILLPHPLAHRRIV